MMRKVTLMDRQAGSREMWTGPTSLRAAVRTIFSMVSWTSSISGPGASMPSISEAMVE
jgi:hypothetical protein